MVAGFPVEIHTQVSIPTPQTSSSGKASSIVNHTSVHPQLPSLLPSSPPCLQWQDLGLSCLLDTPFPLHLVLWEATQEAEGTCCFLGPWALAVPELARCAGNLLSQAHFSLLLPWIEAVSYGPNLMHQSWPPRPALLCCWAFPMDGAPVTLPLLHGVCLASWLVLHALPLGRMVQALGRPGGLLSVVSVSYGKSLFTCLLQRVWIFLCLVHLNIPKS